MSLTPCFISFHHFIIISQPPQLDRHAILYLSPSLLLVNPIPLFHHPSLPTPSQNTATDPINNEDQRQRCLCRTPKGAQRSQKSRRRVHSKRSGQIQKRKRKMGRRRQSLQRTTSQTHLMHCTGRARASLSRRHYRPSTPHISQSRDRVLQIRRRRL